MTLVVHMGYVYLFSLFLFYIYNSLLNLGYLLKELLPISIHRIPEVYSPKMAGYPRLVLVLMHFVSC